MKVVTVDIVASPVTTPLFPLMFMTFSLMGLTSILTLSQGLMGLRLSGNGYYLGTEPDLKRANQSEIYSNFLVHLDIWECQSSLFKINLLS